MAIEQIKMPQLGESVTEGTITKWLVSVGDKVNKYDSLTEVMTDKVNAEVPSSFTGVIKELVAEEGATVAVGEIICTIETESGETQQPLTKANIPTVEASGNEATAAADQENKGRYSPAVLKISQENGIDLTLVSATGASGRITRKDLLKLIESGTIPVTGKNVEATTQAVGEQALKQAVAQQVSTSSPALPGVNIPVETGDIEIPVTGIRKAIAANMLRSKHEAPHA